MAYTPKLTYKGRPLVRCGNDIYYGSMSEDVVSSIELPSGPAVSAPVDVYSITGVRVRTATTSLDGLPSGIYIVGGRKVLVK